VVGDWNNWDGRACPMAKRFRAGEHGGFCGLWEVFVTWSCNVFVFLELGTGWFGGVVSKKLGIYRGMQIFFFIW
jgi:hypothetical protein